MKKALSIILAIMLLLSVCPAAAFAAESDYDEDELYRLTDNTASVNYGGFTFESILNENAGTPVFVGGSYDGEKVSESPDNINKGYILEMGESGTIKVPDGAIISGKAYDVCKSNA